MKHLLSITAGLLLASACLTAHAAPATDAADALPVVVVAHIDIVRSKLDKALPILRGYVAQAKREAGNRQIELLVQIGESNHFALVETWADRAAYDTHVGGPGALAFRKQVDPYLASPYDERLHNEVAP